MDNGDASAKKKTINVNVETRAYGTHTIEVNEGFLFLHINRIVAWEAVDVEEIFNVKDVLPNTSKVRSQERGCQGVIGP